jgi:hypothetical protein
MPGYVIQSIMFKLIVLIPAVVGMFCGCSTSSSSPKSLDQPSAPQPQNVERIQLRSNAAGLLFDLLEDEKNVGEIFVVKSSSAKVINLVKLISATALVNEKELTQLAEADPGLNLKSMGLPPGETAARAAESKSEEYDLLFSSGTNFEFNLLLTQAQAEDYGWHLAKVAADNSTLMSERKSFTGMSMGMQRLYEETVKQMRSLATQ